MADPDSSYIDPRMPQFVDPATGISYEDHPVVLRPEKKKGYAIVEREEPATYRIFSPTLSIPENPSVNPADPSAEVSFHQDERFESENVMGLNTYNFDSFIRHKEKALIFFYHLQKNQNKILEDEFSRAADKVINFKYGFGAVDCFYDAWLCGREETMRKSPMFKLYSNGFELSRVHYSPEFNANQMHMLMKMTPILTQPRVEIGKRIKMEADAAAECKPPKKSLFGFRRK